MRFNSFSSVVRALRAVFLGIACALLITTAAAPALAFGGNASQASPSEGTAQLDQVQDESEDAISGNPRGMESVQSKANRGLNGVQGTADAQKMSRPENSQSARSVEESAKSTIEKATPN